MRTHQVVSINTQRPLPLDVAGDKSDRVNPVPLWRELLTQDRTPSANQKAIFDFVLNGQGDGIINAVTRSGKTRTLVQSARLLQGLPNARRATFAAFNRHIAETLRGKLSETPMTANTINGWVTVA